MRWTVAKNERDGTISALQEVEIGGEADAVRNHFSLSEIKGKEFTIELANQDIGDAKGSGLVTDEGISWEFRFPPLEGFEHYTKEKDGTYIVHAEYAAQGDFRTKIKGKLWRKGKG